MQTSGGFHSPHVDATTSYRTKKNASHHQRHHGHHKDYYQNYYRNYYQTHKQQKQKCRGYKTNKKHNLKANKNMQDPTAIDLTTRKDDDSDDGTGQNAEGSNTGDFGMRKARNKQLLVPKGCTGTSSNQVQDRMKHPKLVGADVYVARLVNDTPPKEGRKKRCERKKQDVEPPMKVGSDTYSTVSDLSAPTGSLHDELICRDLKPGPSIPEDVQGRPTPAESRPCYRCVAYMHSVGIKRVFWTTDKGRWEGAKIRDLVDQLNNTMQNEADTPLGLSVPGVFVTKHEVLLLKRLMGGQG